MGSQNGEHYSASTLFHAQTHIWNHIFSFINSVSLKSAIDLNILDIIHKHGKPMTPALLISSLHIHPSKTHNIYRLMRILIHSGFFSLHKLPDETEKAYVLTDASILLLKDNPFSVTPFLLAMLDPILTKPWYQLANWFQNDNPTPFNTAHGKTFWEYAGVEPKLNHLFNEAMASDARLVTSVVIDKCKGVFNGLDSLVDVGGGTRTAAKAIAKAFLEIQCTVFDLPHVVDGLQGSGNLKFVRGDMFEAIPPSDGIRLKWILNSWNDEECVKILKKSKEAITSKGKEGKVIIIDMVMENSKGDIDDESVETQLFFDMLMMVVVTGKERNEKEWAQLISSAGFSDYKITHVLGLRSLIEVFP
ncbi:hypothetical protein QN277_009083 [Acacia crassicarpa]|uniref:isoflavone 7-O-methyltransferase n=1 Tax=Acacia crassicarpa TaxID=499986 RepID=A0AAE1IT42_9FABA|nr:hypothetical protein QN277_009083 [Acacia crassicarpa]